jgi:hypothetical protein
VTLRKTRVTLISSDVQMSENPAHRGPTDVQPASDFGLADAGAMQLADFGSFGRSRSRAAESFAVLPGMGETGTDTFSQDFVFEGSVLRFSAICC